MFNLIRKDLVLQKSTLLILLPALVVYLLINTSSIWDGIVFSIAIIMNAFAIDEKTSTHTLLNSLPYTRKEIVGSKYIGAFIFTGIVVFTIFIGNLIIHKEITLWKDILLMVSLVLVAISLIFPFSYKFKSQYLFIATIVLFVVYMVVINFFILNLNDKIRAFIQMLLTVQSIQFYWMMALSVMALYACSWLLSIRIYERKVF